MTLCVPYTDLAARAAELPADRSAKIVVYCRSDRMSRIAADEWAAAGYTNLLNLDGGFVAWEAAGSTLEEGLWTLEVAIPWASLGNAKETA